MLDAKVVQLLNEQINKELYSAYLYLDFSNYFYDKELNGFGNWYKIQAQEERDHAMLFLQYLQNNGEQIHLDAIAKPDVALTDNMTVLKAGLKHEVYVTGLIHTIYEAAYAVRDFRTMQFLDWIAKWLPASTQRRRSRCKAKKGQASFPTVPAKPRMRQSCPAMEA